MKFSEFKEVFKRLKTDEERKQFIHNRVNELINSSSAEIIGKDICGDYLGFIAPNTEVVSNSSPMFSNMIIDDLDIYESFMDFIENNVDNISSEILTIMTIQRFVWNYFGYNAKDLLSRMDINSRPDLKPVSIKELKGNDIAACSERSALVQNLLKFLGFDTSIVFGKLNNNESHSYIVFRPENGNFRILYDPMNPVPYKYDGKTYYGIGVTKISNEEYENLKQGQPIKFNYDLVRRIYGDNKEYEENPRIYASDSILYSKDRQI